jgi:protein-tyrosine phosphatase
MASDQFGVLFICHANLCRSPMAERLAGRTFVDWFGTAASQVWVASAGTHAQVGHAMHPGTAQVLQERRAVAGSFASRPATAELVTAADLVLTATREQRAACVTLAPAAVRYTFTLRQFGRMSAGLAALGPSAASGSPGTLGPPAARMRTLLDEVVGSRSRLQPADASDDDLADPIGRSVAAFRTCAAEIQRSLDAMIAVITAP